MFIPFGTREIIPRQRFPVITAALVVINIAVFVYQVMIQLTLGDTGLSAFMADFGVVPARLTGGALLEPGLVTSMFLHGGLLHIVSNMLYLLPFGDNVEDRLGHTRYLVFYLLCGIAASLVHVGFNPGSVVPVIGASGAIAGVLGAYLMLVPGGRVRGLLFLWVIVDTVELPAIVFIGFWFVLQLFNGLASLGVTTNESGGVAFWAHIGGFLAGLLLAPLLKKTES
jgi:membrane associated rhomboid family serine protease